MSVIGIIPARMASTRFPGKPLAKICGIPMIGHIYLRSCMAKSLDKVYIATCDDEIAHYAGTLPAKAIMTSERHERATDRTAEAMKKIEDETGEIVEIVVMIQGDEPLVTPALIDALISPMQKDDTIEVTNLIAEIEDNDEFNDPNVVKVVLDTQGYAIYFSREPIPSVKKFGGSIPPRFKQLGIIAFRRSFLLEFNDMPSTPLEKIESVDMLRVLENGRKIMTVNSPDNIYSVDTREDLEFVESVMVSDPLMKKYRHR
jgi:3-deoxy-manno-octulosonate cytidylyltransferase (CMP-KDO synthetase)